MNFKQSIAIGLIAMAVFTSFGCGNSGEKNGVSDTQPKQQLTQQKQEEQQEQQVVMVKNELSNIVLEVPNFEMSGGKATLGATITNKNSEGVTIKEAIIEAQFDDLNGQLIWKGWTHFDNINLYIPAGEQRRYTFNIIDPGCPHYEGKAMVYTRYVFGK